MNIKLYRSAGNLVCFTLLFIGMVSQNKTAFARSPTRPQAEFDKLAKAYHSNRISAQQYFVKADSLTHQLFSEGKHFETKELLGLLSLYEEIAWSNPEHGRARASYFFLLFNNARMFKKRGASMYYAEKITEELKKLGQEHPLVEPLQKTKIYQELRLYDKVISVYENERSYLASLPELLQADRVDESVGLNAMYILSPVLTGYVKMNDTASVYQTALLAKQIGTALQRSDSISRTQKLYNDLLMIEMAHSIANFEHRYDSVAAILNRMEALKTTYKDQATNFIDINLIRLRLENYRNLKHPDSLRFYLEKYESSPIFGDSQRADVDEFTGQLQAMHGNYQEAYVSVTKALKHERELQMALMAESSDLLYAYTQAEHNEIALQKAENVKQQRTLWLIIISSAAAIIVLAIYMIMLRQSRKAKEQLDALNDTANTQVMAMEEAKHQAVRDEQQRLGQDLHDGLSSSIAGIRHQLEVMSMDTDDASLKNKLGILQTEVSNVYEVARNKSHEWFAAAEEREEQSFARRIKLLTDSALPDSHYHKDIHIDDRSLARVNADTRIALLRIIQEAITNIIKHARAKSVGILIYEEIDNLLLVISDDGKGLGEKKPDNGKSTMGLQSIRRRVLYLNGETNIQSTTKGTEITISIPLTTS
ncbi:hypothetical protein GCM10007415_02310 [Parapedobacter pyrenivorans]|uniref:Histidine kinase domain-containing protein n=1 Tax=Parapedobacter pyrenivorans TaxID=1305674 RepID=A0A917HCR1_9SPHI|nr:ATP-binding protein [Parapedobacter pyrenivorans]GGG74370.1 hypothetical protein GCM10007415_02310 [Parapedobacter pyrenivorans]